MGMSDCSFKMLYVKTHRHIDTELEKGGRRETYNERERERFRESDPQRQKDLQLIKVIM